MRVGRCPNWGTSIVPVVSNLTQRAFHRCEGKRPHRRRTLKPDDEQRCIAAMQEALSA